MITMEQIAELERLWTTTCQNDWQQDTIRKNLIVDKGAMTDTNAICTVHGETWEKYAQFIVMARNMMPGILEALKYQRELRGWHETENYILHFHGILEMEITQKETGRKLNANGMYHTALKKLALQCKEQELEAAIEEMFADWDSLFG